MGTFDILNLRINGYDFHVKLMAGKESWTGPEGRARSSTRGASCCRTTRTARSAAPGRTPRRALANKKSGMYLLGMFVGQQFEGAAHDDLDFFAFPEIDSNVGMDTMDAPIDGFMLSKKPKNEDGAKALLEYLASAKAQSIVPQDATRTTSRPPRTPTPAATRRCRRRPSS